MLRIIALAATAALLATSASAESVHIAIQGKTSSEVKTEVVDAAKKLCWRETLGSSNRSAVYEACVKATVQTTFAQPAAKALELAAR